MGYDIKLIFGKTTETTREELMEIFRADGANFYDDEPYDEISVHIPRIAFFQVYKRDGIFTDQMRAPRNCEDFERLINWADSHKFKIYDWSLKRNISLDDIDDVLQAVIKEQKIISKLFGEIDKSKLPPHLISKQNNEIKKTEE